MNNIYFVNVFFQQVDGAVGHSSRDFTNLHTAKMQYHVELSAQYNPVNSANLRWATVQIIDKNGYIVLTEHAEFEHETAETE